MPNYCDNSVTLCNKDKAKIDALVEALNEKNDAGDSVAQMFQHLRPNPTGEWDYGWSVDNWGTKWDAGIIDWEQQDDNTVWVSFQSAWSPPIKLYEYLTEQGWDLRAMYAEPGVGFCGSYESEFGEQYYEYDISDEEDLNYIREENEDLFDFAGLEYEREWYLENQEEENGTDEA